MSKHYYDTPSIQSGDKSSVYTETPSFHSSDDTPIMHATPPVDNRSSLVKQSELQSVKPPPIRSSNRDISTGSTISTVAPLPNPVLPWVRSSDHSQDPEGTRPGGPVKDPSGQLKHDTSGRLRNTTSGRLVPGPLVQEASGQLVNTPSNKAMNSKQASKQSVTSRTTLSDHIRTSRTTTSTCSDPDQQQPLRRVDIPMRVDSCAQSTLTGDSFYLGRGSSKKKPTAVPVPPTPVRVAPTNEFLLMVEFHWHQVNWLTKRIRPDPTTMPPTLRPYLHAEHWQIFLQAMLRLAARNHRVGTIYLAVGIAASLAGLAYLIYGIIPLEDRFTASNVAIGAGVGLLTAGLCLSVWGRANRGGGFLFGQDLDTLCHNMTDQVKGITVQFCTAGELKERTNDEETLVFGVEVFCAEEATESSTRPAEAHRDAAHVAGSSDQEQPSSSTNRAQASM